MTEARDTNYTWKGQLDVGKRGEEVVFQWLKQQHQHVLDHRDHAGMREDDVDGWAEEIGTFEIKTDEYDNDRLFLELFNASFKPGALLKSRARWWFYYKPRRGYIVAFKPAELVADLLAGRLFNGRPVIGGRMIAVRNNKGAVAAWGATIDLAELPDGREIYRV